MANNYFYVDCFSAYRSYRKLYEKMADFDANIAYIVQILRKYLHPSLIREGLADQEKLRQKVYQLLIDYTQNHPEEIEMFNVLENLENGNHENLSGIEVSMLKKVAEYIQKDTNWLGVKVELSLDDIRGSQDLINFFQRVVTTTIEPEYAVRFCDVPRIMDVFRENLKQDLDSDCLVRCLVMGNRQDVIKGCLASKMISLLRVCAICFNFGQSEMIRQISSEYPEIVQQKVWGYFYHPKDGFAETTVNFEQFLADGYVFMF